MASTVSESSDSVSRQSALVVRVRRFSAAYLRDTRRGMWDDRSALEPLDLGSRERVLDVGCGTGELTRVLAEESDAEVVALDVDRDLLPEAPGDERAFGDATRLPFRDDAFDLVVCQALLINLPDPLAAVREFARVSSALVAAVEPDNSAVVVESSVDAEAPLAARTRGHYIAGVETDVTLGRNVAERFREVGLREVVARRHDLTRVVEPPYSDEAVASARRKATASRLAEQRRTLEAGGVTPFEYDELRAAWREMGREVVDQMRAGEYHRRAVVPFYVTVGRVA